MGPRSHIDCALLPLDSSTRDDCAAMLATARELTHRNHLPVEDMEKRGLSEFPKDNWLMQ